MEKFNIYRNKLLFIIAAALLTLLLNSCGEGIVDVTEAKYEPKIVIEGYLFPDTDVHDIKITRNFPLNKETPESSILLPDADVRITDLASGETYKLSYDERTLSFNYFRSDLIIKYGGSYKLDVSAVIDGKLLHASSTTTVPLKGFKVNQRNLGSLSYRQKDESGNLKNFLIRFTPSPGSDFYAVSIVPENPGLSNFIFDNAYFKPDTSELRESLDNYIFQYRWKQNVNPLAPGAEYKIEWFDTWFYGNYIAIIYAADKNFADFTITNRSVQEFDGNFHEPKLHIEGDGIGVFGSAIAEPVYFTITR